MSNIQNLEKMEKRSFRVRVFKYANQLYKNTGLIWAECLKKAWQIYRLAKMMRSGEVRFIYKKVDGSIRVAYGTLTNLPVGITGGHKTKPSYKTFCYFDTEKSAFRSFKIENFIAVA